MSDDIYETLNNAEKNNNRFIYYAEVIAKNAELKKNEHAKKVLIKNEQGLLEYYKIERENDDELMRSGSVTTLNLSNNNSSECKFVTMCSSKGPNIVFTENGESYTKNDDGNFEVMPINYENYRLRISAVDLGIDVSSDEVELSKE